MVSANTNSFEEEVFREERNPELLKAKFPGLAIPNSPN